MSTERATRIAIRLILTALALFELRTLCGAVARALSQLGGGALASPGAWMLLALVIAAVFFLRETGRGLPAALAAGGLIGGASLLLHGHAIVDAHTAAGAIPVLAGIGLIVIVGPAAVTLAAHALAQTHPPSYGAVPQDRTPHPPARSLSPTAAPLLAAASGRGPPVSG